MLHDGTKHDRILQGSVLPPRAASTAPRQTLKASASIADGSRERPSKRQRITETKFGQLGQITTMPVTLGDEHWKVKLKPIMTHQ
jgi:hypothetical protein